MASSTLPACLDMPVGDDSPVGVRFEATPLAGLKSPCLAALGSGDFSPTRGYNARNLGELCSPLPTLERGQG
jgi:hypothetical protein